MKRLLLFYVDQPTNHKMLWRIFMCRSRHKFNFCCYAWPFFLMCSGIVGSRNRGTDQDALDLSSVLGRHPQPPVAWSRRCGDIGHSPGSPPRVVYSCQPFAAKMRSKRKRSCNSSCNSQPLRAIARSDQPNGFRCRARPKVGYTKDTVVPKLVIVKLWWIHERIQMVVLHSKTAEHFECFSLYPFS